VRERHGERKDGNVIEVVPNFTDDLAGPGETVVAIPAEQLQKLVHQSTKLSDGWGGRVERRYLISLSVSKQRLGTRQSDSGEGDYCNMMARSTALLMNDQPQTANDTDH
jgi:hypothetical protein